MQGNARADRVDADAVVSRLDRCAAGQRHHASLGGGVVRLFFLRAPAQHRGVVDDHSGTPLHHFRQHGAGHAHGAGERHVDDPIPLFIDHVHQQARAAKPGVVDQHVDALQVTLGAGDQLLYLGFVGNVADLAEHVLQPGGFAGFQHRFGQPAFMDIADHQRTAAFFGGTHGGGKTDPGACGGGDQHRLAAQQAATFNILRYRHELSPFRRADAALWACPRHARR
ncbi:hypothetical protein D3C78_1164690 [compost metagenome]